MHWPHVSQWLFHGRFYYGHIRTFACAVHFIWVWFSKWINKELIEMELDGNCRSSNHIYCRVARFIGRRKAIIWTNAGILLNGTLGANFNEFLIKIHIFVIKKKNIWKCRLENGSILSRPQCVKAMTAHAILTVCKIKRAPYPFLFAGDPFTDND